MIYLIICLFSLPNFEDLLVFFEFLLQLKAILISPLENNFLVIKRIQRQEFFHLTRSYHQESK